MRHGEKLPKDPTELDGITKAAVLLLSIDYGAAGSLLKELSSDSVEDVTRVLAGLGEVPRELAGAIIEEFYFLRMASEYSREGGLEYASMLLKESLDPKMADKLISQIQTQVQKTPFAFLSKGGKRKSDDLYSG